VTLVVRCDQCENERREDHPAPLGWLHVERPRDTVSAAWLDAPGPWDFCSPTCARRWAEAMERAR